MSDDGGCIHPADESEVPARNEMDHSDFQLANVRQPSLPRDVLAQGADPRCGTSKLAQDGLQLTNSYHDLHMLVNVEQPSSSHVLAQVADLRLIGLFVSVGEDYGKVFQIGSQKYCEYLQTDDDGYILLKNLKFQQRMKCLTVIFSWLISGSNLLLLMFWHKFLIQDLEHRNSYKTALQFFQFIPCSSYDDDGRIHSAEESEVPANNEMN